MTTYDPKKLLDLTGAIRTISPIHIGAGEDVLSPLLHYYKDGDAIQLINSDILAAKFDELELVDTYVQSIPNIKDTDKSGFLERFVTGKMQAKMDDFHQDKPIKAFVTGNPIQIDRCSQTNGMPYIPGSSLKGAFRTAILYNWLKSTGKAALKNWTNYVANQNSKIDDAFEEEDKKERRRLLNNIVNKILLRFNEEVEDECFGRFINKYRMPMSCIMVSDSTKLSENELGVYEIDRLNLVGEKNGPSTVKECIKPECALQFDIKIDHNYLNNQKTLKQGKWISSVLKNVQDFCALINQYTIDVLQFEIEQFDHKEVKLNCRLEAVKSRLEDQIDLIKSTSPNTCFMRIGQGKMQFYQTMALILHAHFKDEDDHHNWVNYLHLCAGFPEDDIKETYPATKAVTTIGSVPLGWIEIAFSEG